MLEREKYEAVWSNPRYRVSSPGERIALRFLEIANPPPGSRVIDLGCGTGRAALKFAEVGLDVTCLDFAANCRE